jgi:hypothetical protein
MRGRRETSRRHAARGCGPCSSPREDKRHMENFDSPGCSEIIPSWHFFLHVLFCENKHGFTGSARKLAPVARLLTS